MVIYPYVIIQKCSRNDRKMFAQPPPPRYHMVRPLHLTSRNVKLLLTGSRVNNVGQATTNRDLPPLPKGLFFLYCDTFTSFSHLKSRLSTTGL